MRVLLDECLPRKFRLQFAGYDCMTVPEAGLSGKKNGELLTLAEQIGFSTFVTVDGGIPYQQRLEGRKIAVILLQAQSNRLQDLLPLAAQCLEAIDSVEAGTVRIIR